MARWLSASEGAAGEREEELREWHQDTSMAASCQGCITGDAGKESAFFGTSSETVRMVDGNRRGCDLS